MKFLLLNLILFLLSTALCQTESSRISKWEIGLNFSPDLSYRKQNVNLGYGFVKSKDHTHPRFGFTTGFNVLYMIRKHWGLETGINYSQKGYGTKKFQKLNPEYYEHEMNPPLTAFFYRKYTYAEIPLKFLYKTDGENVRFISSIGFIGNLLITSIGHFEVNYKKGNVEIGDFTTKHENRIFTVTPFISAGVELNAGSKFKIRAEPIFRYNPIQMEKKNASITITNLWSVGLNAGLYYSL